jgi:hypothetical protein
VRSRGDAIPVAAVADVSTAEVDDAFYRSYGEGTAKGLDPALVDPKTGGRRQLSLDAKDAQVRECWMETRRILREKKGYCPPPKGAPVGAAAVACAAPPKNPDRPEYKPGDWNDGGPVQTSTNCYAYATDSRLGHPAGKKPQPGQKSGVRVSSPVNCADVTNAVVQDGKPADIVPAPRCPYNVQEKQPPPEKPGYFRVALVTTSKPTGYDAKDGIFYHNDYHWYRQDEDGSWSHKPGHDTARNVDAAGKPISNPETAARRTALGTKFVPAAKKSVPEVIDYDNFCGYFYVKKGGVKVGS